jgi:hypothetical protein
MRRIAMAVVCLSGLACAQAAYTGGAISVGGVNYGVAQNGGPEAPPFAAAPTVWVNNQQCNPPGGIYDVDHTLSGTGQTGIDNLVAEYNAWLAASDKWYRVKVPAGALLNSSSFDSNSALVSFPGKTGVVTKCFVVESTTPLSNRTACAWGLPGFGGRRNPGCDGSTLGGTQNDVASMWTLRMDVNPAGSVRGIYFYGGTGLNPTNHVVLRDMQLTIAPGTSQSSGTHGAQVLFVVDGDPVSRPHQIGIERSYFHGWDPGDPGQPSGVCAAWTMTGTVNTSGATATWASGNSFGPTFAAGKPITINSVVYTIASVDPTSSDITMTLTASAGTQSAVAYAYSNPLAQYASGCGDDIDDAVKFQADDAWFMWNYVEKIHSWGYEAHALTFGFSSGPNKINENWMEGGGGTLFSGGGPVDQRGGPIQNVEIRRNYLGRDLNYRMLTGNGGSSPAPPWGCGPLAANHKNCPFSWTVKNSLELKLCIQCLIAGNIIENSWPDGQDGKVIVQTIRTISGGEAAGIFDPNGLPLTAIHDVRWENNWIRNANHGVGAAARSTTPGNGGGVSQPVRNIDFLNNIFSNIADDGQFGPNSSADLFQFGSSGNFYNCPMSRSANTAHAQCQIPFLSTSDSHTGNPSYVSIVGGVATVKFANSVNSNRQDPMVGGLVVISGPNAAYNGTFTITGASNAGTPSPTGTFANALTFSYPSPAPPDQNPLCNSASSCGANGIVANFQSLAYSITDITAGDEITVGNLAAVKTGSIASPGTGYKVGDVLGIGGNQGSDGLMQVTSISGGGGSGPISSVTILTGGDSYDLRTVGLDGGSGSGATYTIATVDTSCHDSGYDTSATPQSLAPTSATGLDVYFANAGSNDSGTATCQIGNNASWPGTWSFTNNDVLSAESLAIQASATLAQYRYHAYANNILATTNAGLGTDVACTGHGEGTSAFACWDSETFKLGGNVLQGRASANWSNVGGMGVNYFPASATCSGPTPDASCIGFVSFVSGGKTFPTAACSNDQAPFNCPLMALPWADNFRLSDLVLAGSNAWLGKGADISAITNAFMLNQYVCPTGLNCGSPGPYPDN